MKSISIKDAQRLSSPNPFGLVVTCDASGRSNIMALSWWTYASNNPPTLAICLSNRGYSGELINANKEFSLCLIDEKIASQAYSCGTCSGRSTDKAEKFGIELIAAQQIAPNLIKESRVSFECRLDSACAAGDHTIFIAQIVAIHGDEQKKQLYAVNGYSALKTI